MPRYKEIDTEKIIGTKEALEKINKGFKNNQAMELRKISNSAIEKVLLTREPELVEVSIISYGLSKILRKPHYREAPGWKKFKRKTSRELSKTTEEEGKKLNKLIKIIHGFNEEAGNYIESVIHHARIKQASRLYALGLSLNSAADVTGAEEEQLLQYIGSTKISEKHRSTVPLKDRYNKTRDIIGG